jgi:transposase
MSDSVPEDAYKNEEWLRQKYVDDDLTMEEIGDFFDVTASSVYYYLKKFGIDTDSRGKQLSDEQLQYDDKDWLFDQYIEQHKPTAEIAKVAGVSPRTIQDWLKKHDIDKRPRGTRLDPDHIVRNEGWLISKYKFERLSIEEIADEADVNHKTVRRWMEKFGIERRDPGEWEMPNWSRIDESNPIRDEEWFRKKHHEEMLSTYEIADEAGVSRTSVYNYADKHGIELRDSFGTVISKDNPIRDPDWIREKYVEEGLKTSEIAELADVNRSTAENWMDRFGIERRGESEARAEVDISRLKNEEWISEKYENDDLSIADIAEIIGCGRSTVANWLERHDIERPDPHATGADAPNWRGGHDNDYGYLWPEQRAKALRRDQHRCQRCGMTEPEHREQSSRGLHVHHKTPYREFDDDEQAHRLENLITYCESCHMKVEYSEETQ